MPPCRDVACAVSRSNESFAGKAREACIRVLLTHPWFWPHVRRGAEREVHDVGTRLLAAGHRPRLLTSTPRGLTRRGRVDELPVRYVRCPRPERTFGGPAAVAAAAARADLVHAFFYADGWGAALGARLRGRPVVLKLTGTVRAERLDRDRVDAALFRRALAAADEVWCNSVFAVEEMAEFGVPMRVVPAGVDADGFRPCAPRAPEPVVLCTSAPTEPRKRLVDLFDAWPAVLDAVPEVRLRVAGEADDATRRALLDRLPAGAAATVAFLGALPDAALAAEYSAAWATAMPAVYEALGLATLESLACGTPVAGARSGATPELLAEAGTGVLFAPADAADCARAVVDALRLGADPATAPRCRGAALPRSWEPVMALVVERYQALLGR